MNKICVFCGSSPGANPLFRHAAEDLGKEIAKRKMNLVYGGSDLGLMGILATSALKYGAKVIGVMPRIFDGKVTQPKLTELILVDSMIQRKEMMIEMSDTFIALPGGLGTLEEILEVITLAQIGHHKKPCGIINIAGFFDPLLKQLQIAEEQRFIWDEHRRMLLCASDPAELINQFNSYVAPDIEK